MVLEQSDTRPPGAIGIFGDQGFVARLDENCAGSDLTVVNAARVSFRQKATEFADSDKKLLDYLAKNKHMSPFRHPQISFHLKAPEALMRQAYKHVVGIDWTSGSPPIKDHAWNEISGRYVVYEDVYEPTEFRPQSDDNKQASDDGDLSDLNINQNPHGALVTVRDFYRYAIDECTMVYKRLLAAGVSKEQARLVMPFATFTEVIWTCSLEAVVHFVKLRNHHHAQYEIREFAKAVEELAREQFPYSLDALLKYL